MNIATSGTIQKVLCGGALGLYHMAYREWGDPLNPQVLVCVHGLTRNSLDFERLAHALSDKYRVIAPDVVGRGESDCLVDPMGYNTITYAADMITLLAKLNVAQVDWLGTSMGGLIGMMLAGQTNSPIKRLILDDVGPTLSLAALKRIVGYVGEPYEFSDTATARRYVRTIFTPFALKSDDDWDALIDTTLKPLPKGGWRFNYDRNIRKPLEQALLGQDINLWPIYDRIQSPTLLIHDEVSDLLSPATAQEMTQRGSKASLKTVAGVGHAPMFMSADQIDLVRDFLESA
jgi:pimeloyl-ACP methyl ester carboxylesterase